VRQPDKQYELNAKGKPVFENVRKLKKLRRQSQLEKLSNATNRFS
jgi:hypothetical protein